MPLNNVPLPGQTLGATRDPINQNFSVIDTTFSIDHVGYNVSGGGKHNKLTLPLFSGTPNPPTFVVNEIGLYNQNAAPTTRPDIWMARGTANAIPITGYSNGTIGGDSSATCWTYLPSGLKMISGKNTTAGGTKTIVFTTTATGGLDNFPGFQQFVCYASATRIKLTSGTTVMQINSFSLSGLVVGTGGSGSEPICDFFWMAMGL